MAVGLTLFATPAAADVELAPIVVIDFSSYQGTGFTPSPDVGQLDSDDWSITLGDGIALPFGGTEEGELSFFARGLTTGGVDDSGIWAFDVDGAGTIGLGVQPSGSTFTPGRISLRLVNTVGYEVSELRVEYTIWVLNDAERANSFDLEHSADHVTYSPVGDGFTSFGPPDANGFTPTDVVEIVVPASPIADGSQYYLAWAGDDTELEGSARDEFALEGLTIRLLNVCGNGLQEDDEACDDANTDDGDGCAADCTIEEASTTSGGSETAGDSETGADSSGGGDTGVTATDASTSAPTTSSTSDTLTSTSATSATATGDTDDGESEGGTSNEDDESSGCSCTAANDRAAGWGLLGLLGVCVALRRR